MPFGTLVGAGFVRIDADTDPAKKAIKALGALGMSALSTTLLPATAAVTTATFSLAAAYSSAAAGLGIFALAAKGQITNIQTATKDYQGVQQATAKLDIANANVKANTSKQTLAYEQALTVAAQAHQRAQALAAAGSSQAGAAAKIAAKDAAYASSLATSGSKNYAAALKSQQAAQKGVQGAQDTLNQALQSMPAATRDTAKAFFNLTDALQKWSDSLAPYTMPVFTKGLQMITALLPKLTPIVKSTAGEISSFVSTLGDGATGAVFKKFGQNLSTFGGGNIAGLLTTLKNLATGFVGILNAFMPFSLHVSTGLAGVTGKFALFGATLSTNKGFNAFIAFAQKSGPQLVKTLGQLATAAGHMATGMGGIGVTGLGTLKIIGQLASIIPIPILQQLVNIIFAVNAAMKLYAIYTAAASGVTWLFSTAVTTNTGVQFANRAQMILSNIAMGIFRAQMLLLRVALAVSTAAQWLWNAATSSTTIRTIASTVATVAYNVAMYAVRVGLAIAAAAQWLFNTALLASPITWIIIGIIALVAVIILIATKTTWFQTVWKYVWGFLKDSALAVWHFLDTFVFQPLAAVFIWLWQKVVMPAFNGMVMNFNMLKDAFLTVWHFLDQWVFQPIANAFTSLWTDVVQPTLRFIVMTFLNTADMLLKGAVKLVGWVPGVGGALKTAMKDFEDFKNSVNKSLGGVQPKTVPVTISFNGVPQGKITGHTYTSTTGFSYADGGLIRGPGGPRDDKIPVWASNGEWIVDAATTRRHLPLLRSLKAAKRFAAGGMVGFNTATSADTALAERMQVSAGTTRIVGDYVKANNQFWSQMLAGITGSIPTGQHLAIINAALAAAGVPPPGTLPQWQLGLNTLIGRESGWNPNAINLTDSNAKAGHPSQGLAQTIPGTFNTYVPAALAALGITNPIANVAAAIRYIVSRYGSITSVQQANPNLPPLGYDHGGWLMPGVTMAVNKTGRPERVLGPGEHGGVTVNLYATFTGPVGSKLELLNWLTASLTDLKRSGRLASLVAATG